MTQHSEYGIHMGEPVVTNTIKYSLVFNDHGCPEPLVVFHADGRVTVSDKLEADELARKFLDSLVTLNWLKLKRSDKRRQEQQEEASDAAVGWGMI